MPDTTQILEELKGSVHQLAEAVNEMREGRVDRETVERIASEAVERSAAAATEQNRERGYQPEDTTDEPEYRGRQLSERERLVQLHVRSAGSAAEWSGKSKETIARFHEASDNLVLLGAVLGNIARQKNQPFDIRETSYYNEEFAPARRAVSSTAAGQGDEFVPTELSGSLIERVNLALRVVALFRSVNMPTQPFELPGMAVTRTRLGSHAEQTGDTGQTKFKAVTPGTRKVTLTAKKFAGRMLVSREAEEDAIIAILPWMQDEMVDFLAADLEDTLLNGDTAGTHLDADTTAADDPRKNWDGLRKRTQAAQKTDAAAAALTVAMLRKNRKNMGKYGVNPSQLAHLISINSYIDLIADSNVLTVDKYGPNATILSGELGRADGAPLIVSEYVRTDLNATGVNDATAANNTKTVAITVSRRSYVVGERRGTEVEVLRELYAESDQDAIIASTRKAFEALYPTTEPAVALHYNVAK